MNPATIIIVWSLTFLVPPQSLDGMIEWCKDNKGTISSIDMAVKYHETRLMKRTMYMCNVPEKIYCEDHSENPLCENIK